MSKYTDTLVHYVETLADEARALLHATSDAAESRVEDARRRLNDVLESGRDVCEDLKVRASKGVRLADESIRESPYAPIAAALIVGGLVAYLLTRRR